MKVSINIKMRNFAIFTILFYSLIGLSYSQSPYDCLEKAYKENSLTLLDSFFINWQNEIKPISDEELNLQNDTVKAVYELFYLSFTPPKGIKFLVVPNEINFDIADHIYIDYWKDDSLKNLFKQNDLDTLNEYDSIPDLLLRTGSEPRMYRDSIINFRPNNFQVRHPLFFTKKYCVTLNKFLFGIYNEKSHNLYEESRWNIKKIIKRLDFLNHYLSLDYPFRGGWHWETEPEIYRITFNKNLTRARVVYLDNCSIWFAFFMLKDNKWILIMSEDVMCVCG